MPRYDNDVENYSFTNSVLKRVSNLTLWPYDWHKLGQTIHFLISYHKKNTLCQPTLKFGLLYWYSICFILFGELMYCCDLNYVGRYWLWPKSDPDQMHQSIVLFGVNSSTNSNTCKRIGGPLVGQSHQDAGVVLKYIISNENKR